MDQLTIDFSTDNGVGRALLLGTHLGGPLTLLTNPATLLGNPPTVLKKLPSLLRNPPTLSGST
jgi:hypothetical protein